MNKQFHNDNQLFQKGDFAIYNPRKKFGDKNDQLIQITNVEKIRNNWYYAGNTFEVKESTNKNFPYLPTKKSKLDEIIQERLQPVYKNLLK